MALITSDCITMALIASGCITMALITSALQDYVDYAANSMAIFTGVASPERAAKIVAR